MGLPACKISGQAPARLNELNAMVPCNISVQSDLLNKRGPLLGGFIYEGSYDIGSGLLFWRPADRKTPNPKQELTALTTRLSKLREELLVRARALPGQCPRRVLLGEVSVL